MDTKFSLPFVSPSFELLKRSSRFLHFIAAVLITVIASHQLVTHSGNKLVCWSQLVIGAEIFILVLVPLLIYEMPVISLLFRFAEVVILFGNSFLLFKSGHAFLGMAHFLTSAAFLFILYREWRIYRSENIDIRHTGITIPSLAKDAELSWPEIKSVILNYHSVVIETLRNKKIEINLRKGLQIAEKEAIDEFCSRHLSATA